MNKVRVIVENGAISVSPERLEVWQKTGTRNIQLTLMTSGYKFRDPDPVVVQGNTSGQFDPPQVTGNGLKVKIKDKNNDGKNYKYTVFVVETATGTELSVDPFFENFGMGG